MDDLRRDGWDKLLDEVNGFCDLHEIDRVEMESAYIDPRQRRKKIGIRNKHHYTVDCFNDVIDWLVHELDSRFSEATSQLLICLRIILGFQWGDYDELSRTIS